MNYHELLKGRIALVAGATAGIGYATTSLLADKKVKVIMADIEPPQQTPLNTTYVSIDLAQADAADQLFSRLSEINALPDALICNAGRGIQEKLTEGDPAKWQGIIELNLMSHLRLVRAFVPGMLSKNRADVIFTSSVAASQPHPYGGIYSATKAALYNIAETLRQECSPKARVTTITPGVVNSKFFEKQIGGDTSADSFGWGYLEPEDVAEAIIFALSRPERVAVNNITLRPRGQVF